jgi:hypothetical protein
MSVYSQVPVPAGSCVKNTVTNASTNEIVIGKNVMFIITADDDTFIKFGNSGMGAAANTDFYIPAKVPFTFDLGDHLTSVRVFCAGTSKNIYIQTLTKS